MFGKQIVDELGFDVDICRKRQYIFKLYKFALNLNKRIKLSYLNNMYHAKYRILMDSGLTNPIWVVKTR